MLDVRLYLIQRMTALAMAPLVVGHIAVMIYAIQGGLSAEEILGRTQGSVGWAAFYGSFVLMAAAHGAIGIRTVVHETLGMRGLVLNAASWGVFLLLLGMGARAVWAVFDGGGAA